MAGDGLISVKAEFAEAQKFLTRVEKQNLPFAKALSLTRTAAFIAGTKPYTNKGVMQKVLPRVFDSPTRWTLRGFYIEPASKRKAVIESAVRIKDDVQKIGTPAFNYLSLQQSGGQRRRAKRHEVQLRRMDILRKDELTVPGKGMRLNKFGNLTGKTYSKILADVDPAKDHSGISEGRGQATLKRGKRRYFYHPNLRPRGIYLRTGRNKLVVALLFVTSQTYRARFPFDKIVLRAAKKRFPREFEKAMQAAISTNRR